MQRLAQIVARRSQKAGFCQIGELELMRALFDLTLQRGIRLLQLRRHLVELTAKRLKLVVRLDRNASGEIAAADPCGAVVQRSNRHDHPASKEQPGKERQRESGEEQNARAQNRIVKRCI